MKEPNKQQLVKELSTFGKTKVLFSEFTLRFEITGFIYNSENVISVMNILIANCYQYSRMEQFEVKEGFLSCKMLTY